MWETGSQKRGFGSTNSEVGNIKKRKVANEEVSSWKYWNKEVLPTSFG